MEIRTIKEALKYALVGGVATLSDISTLYILVNYFDLYYLYGTVLGFLVGSTVNYFISVNWVFSFRRFRDNLFMEFSSYIAISILVLGFTVFSMWFLTDYMEIYYLYSRTILILFTFLLNFFLRKYFLHREHHEKENYS